jgi:hypothetical protein
MRPCSAHPSVLYKSAAIRVFCAASALCLCVNSFGFPSLRESIFPYAEQVFAFVRAFARNGGKPGLRPFIRCPPLFAGRQRRGLLRSGLPASALAARNPLARILCSPTKSPISVSLKYSD